MTARQELKQLEAEFDIQQLLPVGMTIVVFAIGIAYGLNVQQDLRDDMGEDACAARTDGYVNYNATAGRCYNSTFTHTTVNTGSFNASQDGIAAVAKFPNKLGLIVTVIVAAVVIGILVRYLFVRYG